MGVARDFVPQGNYANTPFITGLLDGYNTMDALAGLAFAIVIISNVEKLGITNPKFIGKETIKSSLVCVVGMGMIYSSLSYLGATSLGSVARANNGGLIISMVSDHYFGIIGKVLLAGIVGVACLKTAIGLITSCSEMFTNLFPNSMSYKGYAFVFTLASFIIANFGLNTIIQLSIPVLMFLHPLAISLIALSLMGPIIKKNSIIYKWTIGLTIIPSILDFINALPDVVKKNAIISKIIEIATNYLPGFKYGFGWLLVSLLGLIIGLIACRLRKNE